MRALLAALAVALAALAAAGYLLNLEMGKTAELRLKSEQASKALAAAQEAHARDVAVLTRRSQRNAATARAAASAGHSVTKTLAANPAWRDQPVPEDVQRALAP